MRLKSFDAENVQQAIQMVRETLGEEAVILASSRHPLGKGVRVTAAVEDSEGEPLIQEPEGYYRPSKDQVLRECERALTFHQVPEALRQSIIETARLIEEEDKEKLLKSVLETLFAFSPLKLDSRMARFMLVGPHGSGKTLACAKLATQCIVSDRRVAVISADTERAGGIEQLSNLTEILGVPLKIADSRETLHHIIRSIPQDSVVILDTPGVNPYMPDQVERLADFAEAGDMETVVVMASGTEAQESHDTSRAFDFLKPHKLLFTRVDCARRLGGMLSAAHGGKLALSGACASPNVSDPVAALSARDVSRLLLTQPPSPTRRERDHGPSEL